MRVRVSTTLSCTPKQAWDAVQNSELLIRIAKPLAFIVPVSEKGVPVKWPNRWNDGGTFYCKSYVLGFIPVGKRKIFLEKIDHNALEIQSRECDPLIKHWDHLIQIGSKNGATTYSDEIEIDAGILTPVVWIWAQWFYRHRQTQWRKLVPHLPATAL